MRLAYCERHRPRYKRGCASCRVRKRDYERWRRTAGRETPSDRGRSATDVEYATAMVTHLRPLSLWEQARYCEVLLSIYLPNITVRPQKERTNESR